jgi:hypothetical protein
MPENLRHHFVPQFYLRNFATDTEKRQIALYNLKGSQFVRSTSIRHQAQRKKLYGTNAREKAFADLEGLAAGVLRHLVERRQIPKWRSAEHTTLMTHILFQLMRTPTAVDEAQESMTQWTKAVASHNETLAPHINDVSFEFKDLLSFILSIAAQCIPIVLDLRHKLLINNTTKPFITSDHPVVLYNQFMEHRNKFGSSTGLSAKGLQIFFPLNPTCCLICFDYATYKVGGRSLKSVQIAVSEEDVEALNILQVANAGGQLFFGNSVSEKYIRQLVATGTYFRREQRSELKEYPANTKEGGILLHASKKDIRVGLKLSVIGELGQTRDYSLGTRVVHERDPVLSQLHREFMEKVDAKQYRATQFNEFIRDKQGFERPMTPGET